MVDIADKTRKSVYLQTKSILKDVTEESETEARRLCSHIFKTDSVGLLFDTVVSEAEAEQLEKALEQRLSGRPLQYIIGEWDFYGRSFFVGEGVLIPRSDTETLIDTALKYIDESTSEKPVRILDLCTGSGCIAITLKSERPFAEVYAVEKSDEAFSYASRNTIRHAVDISLLKSDALTLDASDWIDFFDIIVSNPPYLTEADMQNLQREVSFEPKMALEGGKDGLLFYRRLTEKYSGCLKKGGALCYEIGIGQENDVAKIMLNNCLNTYCFSKDICGIIRVVQGVRS